MSNKKPSPMTRGEFAKSYFENGYNCAQATVLAFADLFSIDKNELLRSVSPLGGGLSRLRETCGVVSALSLVIGQVYGYNEPNDDVSKAKVYQITQNILLQFEKEFGSLSCRYLLKKENKHDSPIPTPRTKEFYASRPCGKYIEYGVNLLEDYLRKDGKIK